MKFLSRLLLLCLLGWGGAFAQNVATTINASSCEKPEYPSSSKRLEEEGTVQLKFLVGADGKVIESAVEKSSGFRRLDEAARQGLSKCTFKPGTKDGVAVESWASMKYTWRLGFGSADQLPTCQGSQPRLWNNCYGTMKSSAGYEYVGDFLDGKKHGQGAYTYLNGDRYVGQFKDDKFNGQGTFSFSIGDVYEGEFKDGNLNGLGTLKFASGNKYVGQLKDGKRSGLGTLYSSIGAVAQVGIWADDKYISSTPIQQSSVSSQSTDSSSIHPNKVQSNLHACPASGVFQNCFGTYTFPSGEKYVGEFVNNLRHGKGTFYTSSGLVVSEGIWADGRFIRSTPVQQASTVNQTVPTVTQQANIPQSNLPACQGSNIVEWSNCVGSATFNDGNRYVGEFKDGKLNGQGTYITTSGVKLVGEFKDSQLNGQGTVTHPNGEKTVGEFKDGQLNGQGTVIHPNGEKTVGEFKGGKRNGQGTNTFASGNKYVGEFKDDAYNGQGTFTFASGVKYVGEWKDNRHNGQGTLYGSNGLVINQGIWTDGKLVGSVPAQQLTTSNSEIEKLRADEAERKQVEAEVQLKLAQQSVQPNKPTVSSVNERRVALVIGNATYKVNPLKNPVNDSTDMARSLRSVGFEVIEANNTTLAQMREVTRRFADKLGNSDVGLVYYSGHGVEVKGKNYLIPVNADIKREYEVVDQAFDASQFLEMMDNIRGPNNKRVNILIVDACRNNELQKSWRSTNNGLARMDAPGGTFISFATAPGKVAADGTGRNSPYTKHLLQALKQPNVPIEQVFKVVRRNVIEETKGEQIPWENSSLVGDFYFTVQR